MAHDLGGNQPAPSGAEAFIEDECRYLHGLLVRRVEEWGVGDEFGRPREVRYVLPRNMVEARILPGVEYCTIASGVSIIYPPNGEGSTPIVRIFTAELGPEVVDDAVYYQIAEAALAGNALWAWYWRVAEIGKNDAGGWCRKSEVINGVAQHAAHHGFITERPYMGQMFEGFKRAYEPLSIRQEFETVKGILREVSNLG